MNALPAGAGPPELDWDRWSILLQQYAAATGLVVSLYDEHLQRRVGPLLNSRLARVLSGSKLWSDGGPGAVLEEGLAARALSHQQPVSDTFCTELHVRALPVQLFGQTRGVIVFGWIFCSFPTALANDRIAREVGLPPARLWREVRLESPISPVRMTVLGDLLQTLVEANAHQTEAIEGLRSLSRMRDVFLARVSHDLRTPLTAISLRIEALLLGRLDDPVHIRQVLEGMQASVSEEARLIEDLIDAARTRTGQLSVKRTQAELVPILRAAVAAIQPQADKKAVRLQTKGLDTPAETPIYADESRLQQVFWNLLSNAVKFTLAGGDVTVELQVREYDYEIRITDSGAGIDGELLPKVFDAFAKRETDNETGLGLGLPIARHIVDQHGGSIRAWSAGPRRGATFTVTFPRDTGTDALDQAT